MNLKFADERIILIDENTIRNMQYRRMILNNEKVIYAL